MTNTDTTTPDDNLMDSKQALTSVSFWGGLTTLVPLLITMSGLHISQGEAVAAIGQVHMVADSVQNGYLALISLFGFLQMAIGRYNAKQRIHFLTPFKVDASGKKVVTVPQDVGTVMLNHPLPTSAKPAGF